MRTCVCLSVSLAQERPSRFENGKCCWVLLLKGTSKKVTKFPTAILKENGGGLNVGDFFSANKECRKKLKSVLRSSLETTETKTSKTKLVSEKMLSEDDIYVSFKLDMCDVWL